MKSDIYDLIREQKSIQKRIQLLTIEQQEITDRIEQLLSFNSQERTKDNEKSLLKNRIKELGFAINSNKIGNVRTLELHKDNQIYQLIMTHSSYHKGLYNGWYTLKPNVKDIVDFIIFLYSDYSGKTSYIILDRPLINMLVEKVPKMPDDRINIKLKANHKNAIETQSKMDLSSNINNINILIGCIRDKD